MHTLLRPALAFLSAAALLTACGTRNATESATTTPAQLLTPGPWRGELATQGQQIPFQFEVKTEAGKPVVYLINEGLNGGERLRCDSLAAAGDSVTIRLHVFDAALVMRANGKDKLKGAWVKYDAKGPYRVPLVAEKETAGAASGPSSPKVFAPFSGTWRTTFKDETGKTYPAVGVFKADTSGWHYTGTFLTTTGDYRYLSGYASGRTLTLSTFDGSHAFLFEGITDPHGSGTAYLTKPVTSLEGDYYSGKSGHETWTATLDPRAKLPDADTLTYLKKGETRLNFSFPGLEPGSRIAATDPRYLGKVVVLQILGSWCPNCMDETAYLAPWYAKNRDRGVEVIGLGYERSPDYAKAAERLRGLKQHYSIGYDLAVAGTSNKDSVAASLPQLAKFLGFPTTIFLDRKGVVRAIHTGFSGPGTGKYYDEELAHFNATVDKLLAEK